MYVKFLDKNGEIMNIVDFDGTLEEAGNKLALMFNSSATFKTECKIKDDIGHLIIKGSSCDYHKDIILNAIVFYETTADQWVDWNLLK